MPEATLPTIPVPGGCEEMGTGSELNHATPVDSASGEVPVPISSQPPTCRRKKHREDLQPNEVLCDHCAAKCCRYFALPIDKPTDWQDFDYIRWYLLHEQSSVFTEEDCWYLLVQNRCKHLGDDHLCGIYETRPQICRDYTTVNCEYEDDWVYDHYWETPEQIEEYAVAVLGPRDGESFRSAKPPAASLIPNP